MHVSSAGFVHRICAYYDILVSPPYYGITREFAMTAGTKRYEFFCQHGSFFGIESDIFAEISLGEAKDSLEVNREY